MISTVQTLVSKLAQKKSDFRSWLDTKTLTAIQQKINWKSTLDQDWGQLEAVVRQDGYLSVEAILKITDLFTRKWVKTMPSYDYDSSDLDEAHGDIEAVTNRKFKRKRRQ
jgi:hypothetical protein